MWYAQKRAKGQRRKEKRCLKLHWRLPQRAEIWTSSCSCVVPLEAYKLFACLNCILFVTNFYAFSFLSQDTKKLGRQVDSGEIQRAFGKRKRKCYANPSLSDMQPPVRSPWSLQFSCSLWVFWLLVTRSLIPGVFDCHHVSLQWPRRQPDSQCRVLVQSQVISLSLGLSAFPILRPTHKASV